MIIGLTGQIGAGKSTVAKLFEEKGAVLIDADSIGKKVINDNRALLRQLVKEFGKEVVTSAGALNKAALAKQAFADTKSTTTLNRLVHPYLLGELRRQIKANVKMSKIVVIDAALLHHWNLEREMDVTIAVYAPYRLRLKRLLQRGISNEDARNRDRAQLSFVAMKRRSDIVLRNTGSRRELCTRFCALWKRHIASHVDR